MAGALDALAHVFRPGDAPGPALLALHGTGGDELDMLPLASAVAPGAPVLSPRGAVREGSANRWFRRFAEGVFDLDDLRRRAADLAAWVAAAREAYRDGLAGRPLVALGYSNGANVAAAALLAGHRGVADAAVLLRAQHAQHAQDAAAGLDLRGLPALLVSSAADPVVPEPEAARLAEAVRGAGAAVAHETIPTAGHGLDYRDVALAQRFLSDLGAPPG
jgi:phospholipase/carboxylesterase